MREDEVGGRNSGTITSHANPGVVGGDAGLADIDAVLEAEEGRHNATLAEAHLMCR
jgi:hypothetical protein